MSKYKEKALQILNEVYDKEYRSNYKTIYPEQCIIEAMCQLAEEVEKDVISKMFSSNPKNQIIYTKEQVEKLLAKQRELTINNTGFIQTTSVELNSKDYQPFITADDGTIWTINKNSGLNAKLKID